MQPCVKHKNPDENQEVEFEYLQLKLWLGFMLSHGETVSSHMLQLQPHLLCISKVSLHTNIHPSIHLASYLSTPMSLGKKNIPVIVIWKKNLESGSVSKCQTTLFSKGWEVGTGAYPELTCMFLGCGRKPECQDGTHIAVTCKLHTERPPSCSIK